MPGRSWRSGGLLVLLSIVWGSGWVADQMIAGQADVLSLAAMRYLFACLCLGLAWLARLLLRRLRGPHSGARTSVVPGGVAPEKSPKPGFAILWALEGEHGSAQERSSVGLVLGFTMFALPTLLLIWSAQHGSAAWTPVIYAAMPLGLMLVAGRSLATGVLGLGAMLILLNGSLSITAGKLLWALPIVAAVALQGWSLVYVQRHLAASCSLRSVMIQLQVAAFVLFAWQRIFVTPTHHSALRDWNVSALGAFAWLVVIATAVAYPFYYRLLGQLEPQQLSSTFWLQTLVAVCESALLMHQRPTGSMLCAAGALLACTYYVLQEGSAARAVLKISPEV